MMHPNFWNLRRLICGLAIAALAIGAGSARAVSYDFNSGSAGYLATFTEQNGTASYFTFGGVGNSGSIRGAGSNQWAAIYSTPFANAPGMTFTLSIEFLGGFPALTSSGDVVGIGLLSTSNVGFQANQTNHYYYENTVRLNNFSNQNQTQFQLRQGGPSQNLSGGISSFSPMLTEDNWYRFTATYTNIGTGFSVNLSLYDIGANGLSAPTLFGSASDVANTPDLAADTSIYFGINGGTSGGDTQYAKRLDNFSGVAAVPEPGVIALCALGGLAIAFARRRGH